jgi:hypothetical protein
MKLSREEETFLRHWIYDEAHFQNGAGAAKQLQVAKGVTPAELATVIAAALPEPADQEAAAQGPAPSAMPQWPWSAQAFHARLAEARAVLLQRENARSSAG